MARKPFTSLNALLVWGGIVAQACLPARLNAQGPAAGAPTGPEEYQVILWMGESPGRDPGNYSRFVERLRELGATAGMVYGGADPEQLVAAGLPYYVENMVNRGLCLKWGSKVADWDAFVTAWKGARDPALLAREPSLDDPAWRSWARAEVEGIVRRNRAHRPLAYDLRDELSVTISANPFDFDLSPFALGELRAWLRARHATVQELNALWESSFASWDEVVPLTTDQIKSRLASGDRWPRGRVDWHQVQAVRFDPESARREPTRWNFSPWCDHRSYMDSSLAGVLAELREAARKLDPSTPVGIEGTQMPHAFGGYDLWKLSRAIDWVEPYDIGSAREIFASFLPGKWIVSTLFEDRTEPALRRLWHLLLLGDRGTIVWWSESAINWQAPGWPLSSQGRALAPALREMRSPLARLFLRARRKVDPVAIHYSQPSIQVNWLLESIPDGSTWLRRFSSFEAAHNRQAKVRGAFLAALHDLGWAPRFISQEEVEAGGLQDVEAFILPTSLALSDLEIARVQEMLSRGNRSVVLCDGAPGLFDGRGKLRPGSPLDSLFPPAAPWSRAYEARGGAGTLERAARVVDGDIAEHGALRLARKPHSPWHAWIGAALAGLHREVWVEDAEVARVRIHRFTAAPGVQLLAFERNVVYQMSEDLKQAGGNEALEEPIEVSARLARPAHVVELREQKLLGKTERFSFRLDPWRPSLFALFPDAPPGPVETIVETLLR